MPYKSGKASDKLREDIGDIYIYLQHKRFACRIYKIFLLVCKKKEGI